MRRLVILTALCAVLLALACAGAAAAAPAPTPPTFATFDPGMYGSFAEGMAADSHGNLYVSLTTWGEATNTGEIWQVAPSGAMRLVASMDLTGYGMLTGVAVDRCGAVYVGFDDMSAMYGEEPVIGASVWKVQEDGTLARAVTLSGAAMPNGLAFRGGDLFVTDSVLGAVWKARVGAGVTTVTEPWLQDGLLAPGDPAIDPTAFGLGANGIAFKGDRLFVSVSDAGRIVRVRVRCDGSPGTPRVVREDDALKTADGIAFDALGRLWITTNFGTTGAETSGGLYRLTRRDRLVTVADDPGWLDYPTMPVFGRGLQAAGKLYVANGAYTTSYTYLTPPTVVAITAGVPAAPCR